MNIYDISKKAGVSIATVSRVLNGSDKVSDKTRQRVLKVMTDLNYTPNVFARGLGLDSMKTIGIMCPDASDPFLANGVYYAEQTLRGHGYDTLMSCCGYQTEDKKKSLEQLMSKRIDGIVLIGSSCIERKEEDNAYIKEAAQHIPIAIINGYMAGEHIYCSFCNDFQATFDVTNSLLDKGREAILFLYRTLSYSGRQKLNGHLSAMKARGIEPDEKLIIQMENDIRKTEEQLKNLYERGLRFDSILSCEDLFAVAGVKFAKKAGISIPEEMDIIGYNNSLLSVASAPELTSIDSKVREITIQGVEMLVDALEGKGTGQKSCVPCELIKRETTDF